MSDEQDGFMLNAFGLDLGQMAQNAKEGLGQVANTASQALQSVQGAFEGAVEGVTGVVTGAVKKVAGAVSGSPSGPASGSGTGTFPLGGSVGRGGKNAPNDVRAVQNALGISADGQCGEGTIAAIVAFQRNMGQAKPDGRVDAGGGTERALAGGGRPVAASGEPPATPGGDDSTGIVGQSESLVEGTESAVQSSLQSAQDSVLTGLGASPETVQGILTAEQAIADFDKGRQAGRASGSIGLLEMLPPVQLFKAGVRIADADDGEAEALKIADEKRATLAAIGKFGTDPSALGTAVGEGFGKSTLQAKKEGRLAEFAGNLVGQGDVIAATVAVGGAGAGVEAGGARGIAAGAESAGARGAAAAESGAARTLRGLGDPPTFREPPTLRGLGDPPTFREPPTRPGLGEPVPPNEPGIPPEVDPANPQPKPRRPKANLAETPAQAQQNLIDATLEQLATEQASLDATQDFVRFRQIKPVDPRASALLEERARLAANANGEAIRKVQAAQKAADAAASRAKGSRGRSGFQR